MVHEPSDESSDDEDESDDFLHWNGKGKKGKGKGKGKKGKGKGKGKGFAKDVDVHNVKSKGKGKASRKGNKCIGKASGKFNGKAHANGKGKADESKEGDKVFGVGKSDGPVDDDSDAGDEEAFRIALQAALVRLLEKRRPRPPKLVQSESIDISDEDAIRPLEKRMPRPPKLVQSESIAVSSDEEADDAGEEPTPSGRPLLNQAPKWGLQVPCNRVGTKNRAIRCARP